jgi:hypothetical protein
MKKLLLIAPLVLSILSARADVVIVQKMDSAFMKGEMTMKIKGDKSRIDMPTGPMGAMSMIIDSATGDMSTIMHGQKMVMKIDAATMKQAQEQAKQLTGGAAPEKPKATGKMEKVGEWNAEIYEFGMAGATSKVWVVKDFPNGEKLKAEMMKISKNMGQNPADAAAMDVPGMPVKTEVAMPIGQGKMIVELVKAVEQNVDAKDLEVPKDYQTMSMPTLPK